jgi:DNA ligase-1
MPNSMVPRLPNELPSDPPAGTWLAFSLLCEELATTRSKLAKRKAIAGFLQPLPATTAGLTAQFLSGSPFPEADDRKTQTGGQTVVRVVQEITSCTPEAFSATYRRYGDLGSAVADLLQNQMPSGAPVTLEAMHHWLEELAATRTQNAKAALLRRILQALRAIEAKYCIKLLLGDMRIGVQQSLVEEAIAAASEEPVAAIRRAETMLGDLSAVVALAWTHSLSTARFRMFHPLGFMLATPSPDGEAAFARFLPDAAGQPTGQMENKYDGMRAQIHCGDPAQPGRVRIFSRTREDITASFPDLTEWFANAPEAAVLDGEILAWDSDAARALPFTRLQPRIGRKRVTAEMRSATFLIFVAFDLLAHQEALLLEQPLRERRERLELWSERMQQAAAALPPVAATGQPELFTEGHASKTEPSRLVVSPAQPVASAEQISAAFDAAQQQGNEGLMLKALASVYEPGRRGLAWIKLKRELSTLDVVVTAVEYGNGRRAAVLSDYTFAVRDGEQLRNVGKAYSGLTDAEILELTGYFLANQIDRRGSQILVEPTVVLEVAFNNVMASDRHDSGFALRFPRIVRIRSDKPVAEIDTVERVATLFRNQHKGAAANARVNANGRDDDR